MKIASKYLANARHQTSVRPGFIGEMTRPNTNSGVSRQKLANLGHEISDQTVGNVLRRHGLPSAPARKHTTTWAAFIRVHLAVLAGTDFFPGVDRAADRFDRRRLHGRASIVDRSSFSRRPKKLGPCNFMTVRAKAT